MVLYKSRVIVKNSTITNIKIELFIYILFGIICAIVCYAFFATWKWNDFSFDFKQMCRQLCLFASVAFLCSFILLASLSVDRLAWIRNGVETVSLINGGLHVEWEGKIFARKRIVPIGNIISVSYCKPWQKPFLMASPTFSFRQVGYGNGKIEVKYNTSRKIRTMKFGLFLSDVDARNVVSQLERAIYAKQ